jgi:hypothetical protein
VFAVLVAVVLMLKVVPDIDLVIETVLPVVRFLMVMLL